MSGTNDRGATLVRCISGIQKMLLENNKGGFPNQKIRHQLCNISMIQKISLRYLTPVTWGYGAATSSCVHFASYESIPFKLSCLLSPPQALCEESPDVLLSLIDFVIFNYFGV